MSSTISGDADHVYVSDEQGRILSTHSTLAEAEAEQRLRDEIEEAIHEETWGSGIDLAAVVEAVLSVIPRYEPVGLYAWRHHGRWFPGDTQDTALFRQVNEATAPDPCANYVHRAPSEEPGLSDINHMGEVIRLPDYGRCEGGTVGVHDPKVSTRRAHCPSCGRLTWFHPITGNFKSHKRIRRAPSEEST